MRSLGARRRLRAEKPVATPGAAGCSMICGPARGSVCLVVFWFVGWAWRGIDMMKYEEMMMRVVCNILLIDRLLLCMSGYLVV